MDINFSDQTLKTLYQLDRDKNGVSFNELKKLDTDDDQQLSEAEAEQCGISKEDLHTLNKAMKMGKSTPNIPILMDTAQSHGWDEISMELINDSAGSYFAQNQFSHIYSQKGLTKEDQLNLLKERLGNRARLEPFIKFLNDHKLLNHSQFEALVNRVGSKTTAKIGKELEKYFKQGGSRLSEQDKKQLIRDLVMETAVPVSVRQDIKGTCAACAVQMKLAIENPLAYTKMALALVEGKEVKSPGGTTIHPNDTWRLPGVKYGEDNKQTATDGRSISSKALQNAFMNEALTFASYESHKDYNNNEDAPSIGQQAKLLTKVFGEHNFDPDYWNAGSSKLAYLEDDIARGKSAIANFKGHAILVVGMDKTGENDKVIFWSDDIQYQMDAEQFAKDVVSIVTVDDDGWDDKKVAAGTKKIVSTDVHKLEAENNERMKKAREARKK